jgi:GNAT superfamily N-acetyltransferase
MDISAANTLTSLAIRPVESRDAGEVSLLIGQLGYERSREEVLQWIEALDSRADNQAVYVADLSEEVVGWIEVEITRRLQAPAFIFIGGLVVKDGVRGMGIGGLLCGRAELWGRERGVGLVRVTSRSTRIDAHSFYLRDGYEHVKTSLVFEKRLSDVG